MILLIFFAVPLPQAAEGDVIHQPMMPLLASQRRVPSRVAAAQVIYHSLRLILQCAAAAAGWVGHFLTRYTFVLTDI